MTNNPENEEDSSEGIPDGTICEHCDELAEYETDDFYLCEEHHEQHVDGIRPTDD